MTVAHGGSIHYRVEGRPGAPWLTFSHSLACNLEMWDGQVEIFRDDFRILRYDTRGHGRSAAPPGPYSFDLLIGDVIGLWDALNIRATHFVGLSLGGMTALGLALGHPERLLSIAVCNARADKTDPRRDTWAERAAAARELGMKGVLEPSLKRWFTQKAFAAGLPEIDRARAMILSTPVEGYAGCAAAISKLDYLPRLGEIRTPALFVVGSEDPGTPPAAARMMHQAVKGSRLVEIGGAAHLSNLEQPAVFNAAISEFIRNPGRPQI